MELTDTHIHLEELPDLENALAEARAVGVTRLIAMGVDAASSERAAAWAETHPGVFAAAGHHPLNSAGPDYERLRNLLRRTRVVAVGEIGLDSVDEHGGPRDAQAQWFHRLCEMALEHDLPVCVHTRGTEAEVLEAIRAHPGLRGVMHYWALDWDWAQRFLEVGFHISFAGSVTRAGKPHLREVAARVPAERLLLETDAPWGIPSGRRGDVMVPAWMVDTARVVAEARRISIEQLAEIELANVSSLFSRIVW